MKIAIVSYIYPVQNNPALGSFVHAQAREIKKKGNIVEVFTCGEKNHKRKESIDGVKVNRLCTSKFLRLFRGQFFIAALLFNLIRNRKQYDLVHSHFLGTSTIFIGLACKAINLPFLVTSHGSPWEVKQKGFVKRFLLRCSLRYPKKVICVSNATRRLLQPFTDKSKLIVICNGVDISNLKAPSSSKRLKNKLDLKDKIILLSVSNLIEKKGIDIIIKSLSKLIKEHPNLYYIIIGEGPLEKELIKLVNDLGLQRYVRFEKYKNQRELSDYYNLCDVFVLMSRETKDAIESFGIVYIEASYFGKPVIGGKGGGTQDSIEDGKSGFLVDYKKPEELINKLSLLLKNPRLRKKMGEYGRKRVNDKFLLTKVTEEIIELYKEEINK